MSSFFLIALAASLAQAPAPAPPAEPQRALPPGWTWGVQTDASGSRSLVPIAPHEAPPPPAVAAEDPVERARNQLEMLRMALESYHATHRPGLTVYPEARSLDEMVRILQHERTLPLGWHPGGVVTAFRSTATGYLVAVAVAGHQIAITPPHRDNPLSMFWIPPHRP